MMKRKSCAIVARFAAAKLSCCHDKRRIHRHALDSPFVEYSRYKETTDAVDTWDVHVESYCRSGA